MQVRMLQSTAGQVGAGRMQGRCRNLPAWQLTRLLTLVTSGECAAQGNLASTFISPMETMKIEQLQHSQCLTSRMRFPLAQSTTFTWTVGLPEHDLVLFKNHCWKKWEIYRYLVKSVKIDPIGRIERGYLLFFEIMMFLEFLNNISAYVNYSFSCLMMFTIKIIQ